MFEQGQDILISG